MFCSNCGKKITPGQRFCSTCGAENKIYESTEFVSRSPVNVQSVEQINTVFNRNVLTNYLSNLQTLEFAKHKLLEERNIEYRINSLGHPNRISLRNTLSDYGGHFGGLGFMIVVFLLCIWINSGLNGNGFFSIFDDLLGPIVIFVQIAAVIIAIIIICVMIHDHIEDGSRFER